MTLVTRQIFVYPMTGEGITLDVQACDTIRNVKAVIQDILNIPWYEQALLYGAVQPLQLDNALMLADYGILPHTPFMVNLNVIRVNSGPSVAIEFIVILDEQAETHIIKNVNMGLNLPANLFMEVVCEDVCSWTNFANMFILHESMIGFTTLGALIKLRLREFERTRWVVADDVADEGFRVIAPITIEVAEEGYDDAIMR